MTSNCKTKKKGFLLIEVLISLLILSVGVTAIFSLMASSIKASNNNRNQIIAGNLAQEGVELVIGLQNKDKTSFNPMSGGYMIDYTASNLLNISDNGRLRAESDGHFTHSNSDVTLTKFYRKININPGTTDFVVTSMVVWNWTELYPATTSDCNFGNSCVSIVTVLQKP